MLYGFLTDANVELGNYKEAEDAAQWMLDLRPGNLPGMTRAAYLRELFGNVDGALELMTMAYQSTPPSEVEDAAWIVTQMAHLNLAVGKISEAEKQLQQALTSGPAARVWLKFAPAAKLCFISRWLTQAPLSQQTDYAFRRGKDMLQKRLFYVFSHKRQES